MECPHCFREVNTTGACPYCGFDPAPTAGKYPMALKPGSVLNGRYILGHVLGQGGFGITYIALDYQTKERVAIKEYLPSELAVRYPGSPSVQVHSGNQTENFAYGKAQFLEEAKTLAAFIGNAGIVRIYSYFEENGTAYFCMEYVDGLPLDKYMTKRGGRLSPEEAASLLLPLTESLAAVHAKGIVHRDIAPDNILVTKDGTAKLIDFGAARYSTGEKSKSLDVILKHGFAPFEQYSRRGRQGPWTDVYALGATWYYAITGRVPPDSVDRVEEDELAPPSALGVEIDAASEQALMKALAVTAPKRFQSMGEFHAAMLAASEALRREEEARRERKLREELRLLEQKRREEERQKREAEAREAREKKERQKREEKECREREKHETERLKREEKERRAKEKAARTETEKQVKAAQREAKQQAAADRPKKSKLPLILGAVAVLAAVLFFAFGSREQSEAPAVTTEPEIQTPVPTPAPTPDTRAARYAEAEVLLASGQAQKAWTAFKALGDYQDAAERAEQIAMDMRHANSVPLAAGHYHTVGLHSDGTVVAVGNNDYGQCDVSGWTDIVSISAEYRNTVGLKADGTVVAVGNNDYGQCDVSGWTDIVAVAAGSSHTVGLNADGTVVAVGFSRFGACEVSDWTDIVAVSAGGNHTVALKADGTVVAVGLNDHGQCDVSDWTDIVAISAMGKVTAGLRADGTVVAVGDNDDGQCEVSGWTDIVAVAAGGSGIVLHSGHTVGLKADGTVVAMGGNTHGQCKVSGWMDIVAVAAGSLDHTVGLKADGTVVAVGHNYWGQCDVSDWTDIAPA